MSASYNADIESVIDAITARRDWRVGRDLSPFELRLDDEYLAKHYAEDVTFLLSHIGRTADYVDAFRKAAKGREEYAENASATDREYLMGERDAFNTAARLLDGDGDIVGLLCSACPSWRWGELGVEMPHDGSSET